MKFDDKFLEQLKSKNDIVSVVSAYCNLEKKGGAYWACCPLPGHIEKTPSFCVNETGQFFKCFGCGRGGDVIKFIMEAESLDFADAVKLLAERVGMPLPEYDRASEEKIIEDKKKKERQLSLLKETALFYVRNLQENGAKLHNNYIRKRGLSHECVRAFGIGASLDYKSLPEYLKKLGYSYEEMLSCGVVSYSKEKNVYSDFQAKRLIIPIIDAFKNVVAFGGRVLEAKPDFAKYKNTPETSVFIKNRCLYNINNLKKSLRSGKLDYVIMVEGYMDVISLFDAGFKNVVASMGTSLTNEQARILKRYTDTVVISYDGDGAGQKATQRGLDILKDAGLTVKVLTLPDGLDPDDVIKQKGADFYRELIDKATLLNDYKLESLKKKYDLTTSFGKREFVGEGLKVIAKLDTNYEQEELLKELSALSGISYEYLRRDLEKMSDSRGVAVKERAESVKKSANNAVVVAERFVLNAVIQNKKYADVGDIYDYEFTSKTRQRLADYLIEKLDRGESVFASLLSDVVGSNGLSELNELLLTETDLECEAVQRYYRDCVRQLKKQRISRDIEELKELYSQEIETEKQQDILKIISIKVKKLKELKSEKD
ncbi:MAG: DNA primase [Christensenellaceae bacterium]